MAKNTDGMIIKRREVSATIKVAISRAIDKLVNDKQPINVSSVARKARCSKTTVRKHEDQMERIEGLRAIQSNNKKSRQNPKPGKQSTDDRMISLYDKKKELEHQIDMLKEQLIDQTVLQLKIEELTEHNTRLVEKNTELAAIKDELVKQLEELTKILDKRREASAVLTLVPSPDKEVAATVIEEAAPKSFNTLSGEILNSQQGIAAARTTQQHSEAENCLDEYSLILMVGYPLSGKSTLAQKYAKTLKGFKVISEDNFHSSIAGERTYQDKETAVWALMHIAVREQLLNGKHVIIDSINLTREVRLRWSMVAKGFSVKLALVLINTPPEVCKARNQQLNSLDQSRLETLIKQFEPPSPDEGDIYTAEDIEKTLLKR